MYDLACISAGARACTDCPAGTYGLDNGMCQPCLPGFVANTTSSTVCTACIAGTYAVTLPQPKPLSYCQECGIGTYSIARATSCTGCPSGFVANTTSSTVCTPCQAGTYAVTLPQPTPANYCKECGVGSYSNAQAISCSNCPSGFVANTTGSSVCTACHAGTYALTHDYCKECDVGTYSDAQAISCSNCPPGSYAASTNSTVCDPCPLNSFTDVPGSSRCEPCLAGKVTSSIGQRSCQAVVTSYSIQSIVSDGSTPFYIVIVFALLFGLLALAIERIKSTSKERKEIAPQPKLFMMLFYFVNFGNHFLTEVILVSVTLQLPSPYPIFAVFLVIGRLVNCYPTIIVVMDIMKSPVLSGVVANDRRTSSSAAEITKDVESDDTSNSTQYKGTTEFHAYLVTGHFFDRTNMYIAYLFVCLFDSRLLMHLPWRKSPFSNKLSFPNYRLLITVYKTWCLNSVLMWVAQIALLITNDRGGDLNGNVETILYMNLVSITVQTLYTLLVMCTKRALLRRNLDDCLKMNQRDNDDTNLSLQELTASSVDGNIANPIHSDNAHGHNTEELESLISRIVDTRISGLANRMVDDNRLLKEEFMERIAQLEGKSNVDSNQDVSSSTASATLSTLTVNRRDTIPAAARMSESGRVAHVNKVLLDNTSDDRL